MLDENDMEGVREGRNKIALWREVTRNKNVEGKTKDGEEEEGVR